jgi:thiamine monophosphate synthase
MCTHSDTPLQGYNAQLAINDQQVAVAVALTIDSPDFGHLEPVVRAARTSCTPTLAIGISAKSKRSSAAVSRSLSYQTPVCAVAPARGGRAA